MSDTTQVLDQPGEGGDAPVGNGSGRCTLALVFGAAGLGLALLALIGVLVVGMFLGDIDDDVDDMEQMHDRWTGQMGPGQMGPGQMDPGQMDPGQMGPGRGNGRGPGGFGGMPDGPMDRLDDEDLDDLSDDDREALRERLDETRQELDELEERLDEADANAPDDTTVTTAPAS